jgi:hypothetical protein
VQAREVNNPMQAMLLEVPKNINSLYTRKSMPPLFFLDFLIVILYVIGMAYMTVIQNISILLKKV